MMSTRLMLALIVAYLVIAGAAAWERDWPRVLYYLGAVLISAAVIWMGHVPDPA